MFHIGLKPCCDFYKIYENGLVWFEGVLQKFEANKKTEKK
jgi:hypothetical protein